MSVDRTVTEFVTANEASLVRLQRLIVTDVTLEGEAALIESARRATEALADAVAKKRGCKRLLAAALRAQALLELHVRRSCTDIDAAPEGLDPAVLYPDKL